jgi:hypothetical protein
MLTLHILGWLFKKIGIKKVIMETRHHNQQPSKKKCGLSKCLITMFFGATNLTKKLMKQNSNF